MARCDPPKALDPSAATVLAMIERAADAGEPCPSNGDMAVAAGARSPSFGADVLKRLEKRGLIKVQRGHHSRVVTVISTGQRTAGKINRPHWSERGVVKSPPKDAPHDIVVKAVKPLSPRVHRDPCPCCGIRADIGCHHGWVA